MFYSVVNWFINSNRLGLHLMSWGQSEFILNEKT